MKTNAPDFTASFTVKKSPSEVFRAIMNVRAWWSEEIDGPTDKLNEPFFYHYKDVHLCKLELIEKIPDQKLVYHVLENEFSFTKDKTEWVDTKLIFEISTGAEQTHVQFTHQGLVPEYECYEVCRDGWTNFIQTSLYNLITKGAGQPNPKEGGFNNQLVEKWKLKSN